MLKLLTEIAIWKKKQVDVEFQLKRVFVLKNNVEGFCFGVLYNIIKDFVKSCN